MDLNISRDLFLGLNNKKASFQLLKSQIKIRKINEKIIYEIPVRIFYRTLWKCYSFVVKYAVYPNGSMYLSTDNQINAVTRGDFEALRSYCKEEVYKPCDPLRNYLIILGLIEPKGLILDSKLGIWVVLK